MERKKIQSFKNFSRVPHGIELRNFLRRMVILLNEQPYLGYEILQQCQESINELITTYIDRSFIFSKNEYIAIVGDSQVEKKFIEEIAQEFGFSKNNLRILLKYQNDTEVFKTVTAQNCKFVILGPTPHSKLGEFDRHFGSKIILAKNKGGSLKFTKQSIHEAFKKVFEKMTTKSIIVA